LKVYNVLNKEKRKEFWTMVIFDETQPMMVRLRASELLGKSEGDFVDVVQNTTTHNVLNVVSPSEPIGLLAGNFGENVQVIEGGKEQAVNV
jgi:hypothetical protein